MTLTAILAQQLVNGLVLGSFYALVALGYTMVFGVVKLLNFAHGDLYMVGAFGGFIALSLVSGFAGVGWLGVALTGSDTASNVLFGNLQKITSEQLGLSPILMGAANSSGGVMGKMIDAQSIVVASTATNWFGHEGSILRVVFWHSIILVSLVGIMVMLQAYVPLFQATVPIVP